MKYTYQISFNGVDYTDFTPTNEVKIEGSWIQGTYIFREKISEIKINLSDSSVFTTLESWFTDPTKFETRIWIKRLNTDVQDSLHWFGIKWGKLDSDLTNYTVSPHPYDLYYQYLEEYINLKIGTITTTVNVQAFDEGSTNYPLVDDFLSYLLSDVIKEKIDALTPLSPNDVVSSFMWGDNYADGTPTDTIYGMHKDYVFTMPSVIKYATILLDNVYEISIKEIIELFTIFNVFCYFDSNDKLRFEHISYINTQFNTNKIVIAPSSEDQKFEYSTSEIPTLERVTFDDLEVSAFDDDFSNSDITYSSIRNRVDATEITKSYQVFTNLKYYIDNALTDGRLLLAGYKNLAMNWLNSPGATAMNAFDSDYNHIEMEAIADGVNTKKCYTSDFKTAGTLSYSFNITTQSGTVVMQLKRRSTGSVIDTLVITTSGLKTGTFATSNFDDCYIELSVVPSLSGEIVGDLIIEDNASTNQIRNPWKNGIVSGTSRMNGDFSHANILYNWWYHNRVSKSGVMNGTPSTFFGTQFNLKRDTIKLFHPYAIDMLSGVDDGVRVGMIQSYSKYDTDYVEFNLIYHEDE